MTASPLNMRIAVQRIQRLPQATHHPMGIDPTGAAIHGALSLVTDAYVRDHYRNTPNTVFDRTLRNRRSLVFERFAYAIQQAQQEARYR